MEPDIRDQVVDYARYWSLRTSLAALLLVRWIGIGRGKFYQWRRRYGKVNEHNAWVPRGFWLESWERAAIVSYFTDHPDEGYRRLTYMMMDADVVAVSPSSVYRVLRDAGLLRPSSGKPSLKGTGFVQPLTPNEHWHVDVSYINICGTFYYLCSQLDGCSGTSCIGTFARRWPSRTWKSSSNGRGRNTRKPNPGSSRITVPSSLPVISRSSSGFAV